MSTPLAPLTSIKLKLGLLVGASVLVAASLATLGAGSVPAWLSIPVTVLLALALTQLLASGMTSPLRQMTEATARMAAGDYGVRVRSTSLDEVGRLARAFDTMAEDLEGVDRQRRELVASVSHELRTPLTALVAVLENLDDGVTAPDPATIRTALGQAQRLGDLVSDLLDLSRVDAGVAPLERVGLPLAAVVEAAVAEAGTAARAASRSVAVEVRVEPGLTAYADPRRLHQLLANLLDNATRHSPRDGTVVVEATGHGEGGVVLEVSDEGPGIPAADRQRVFERFGTAAATTGASGGTGGTGSTGGTGLGLAIARWVTDLHGGRIAVADGPGGGALLRVELPGAADTRPATPHDRPVADRRPAMTTPTPTPTPIPPGTPSPGTRPAGPPPRVPSSLTDDLFGSLWRDRALPGRPGVVLAAAGTGVLAAALVPFAPVGIGATLVLLAAGLLVLRLAPPRRDGFRWACALLCTGFALVVTLRAAVWVGTLGLLAAAVLVTAALVDARTARGAVLGALAWPLAGLRGLPWLGRSVRALAGAGQGLALARTAAVSVVAVLVFGLLLASADAVFGRWFAALVPEVGRGLTLRIFTGVAVAGIVLAAAYLALNPPTVEPHGPRAHRPVARRYEWLAPVLLVDAVLTAFLVAQAAAFFGGHDFVQRTTGLTYADYVHQGFAQLTLVTALTLLVVAVVARKAPVATASDRAWLRASTGALCLLTLVVVASALERMALYTDAYGLTRLRLVVLVFEVWLGLVVLGVLAAGVRLRGAWLPRTALLGGSALLLALALANPDAVVARTNLDRWEATGKVDWGYLEGLSPDATPVLVAAGPQAVACALPGSLDRQQDVAVGDDLDDPDAWSGWNLGRARAEQALLRAPSEQGVVRCASQR